MHISKCITYPWGSVQKGLSLIWLCCTVLIDRDFPLMAPWLLYQTEKNPTQKTTNQPKPTKKEYTPPNPPTPKKSSREEEQRWSLRQGNGWQRSQRHLRIEDVDKGNRTQILHAYAQFQATNLALSSPWVLYSDFNRNSEATEVEAQYSLHLSEKTRSLTSLYAQDLQWLLRAFNSSANVLNRKKRRLGLLMISVIKV